MMLYVGSETLGSASELSLSSLEVKGGADIKLLNFGCEKHGNFSNKSRVIGSKKRNCPFKLRATYTVRDGGWGLRVRCGLHTHELLTTLIDSALFGRLTEEEKKMVDEHTALRVSPKDSMNALKKKFAGNVTSMPQLYRQRYIFRSSLKGPRTDIQELMRLIEVEKFLCWSRKVEGTDVVSDIMWAHPTSIKLFRLFPKVLILYSTYKTNKYRIPLIEIVGVTSTEITFSVALLPECPLPPIGFQWERFSSDEAKSWLNPYMGRFQLWVSLAPVPKQPSHPPKTVDLTADSESV